MRPLRVGLNVMGASLPADIQARIVRQPQPEKWELLIAPSHNVPTPGKSTAFFTMYESTLLPKKSVSTINMADVIIVPSKWCEEGFERSGVIKPIRIVPLGVDTAVFKPGALHRGITVFGTAGRVAHGRKRKGIDSVIRAFKLAFPTEPNVALQVKCHPDCVVTDPGDTRITVHRNHWTEQKVATWLNTLTAFVSGATGEGWGLWQQQAMACGRPVIAALYGGLREFMGDENSYPVDYIEGEAIEGWHGMWAYPDERSMAEQMVAVHRNPQRAIEVGVAGLHAAQVFTWTNSCNVLSSVLSEFGALPKGEPVTTVKPRLTHRKSYRPKNVRIAPATTKAYRFYHGVGDCCNAATLFKCLNAATGMKFAVQCSALVEPIFRAAGIETVDFAAQEHRWLHPTYRGPISPPWVDNKTAHNSPVQMTADLWQRLIATEVRMATAGSFPDFERPLTVLHTKGASSGHWKDLPSSVEHALFEYYANRKGTTIYLSGKQHFRNLTSMAPSTIAELYDLLWHADLVIGVDSGPLHLARMTNTPALGCWFGMHPTAFALPSPRIQHLCFGEHPFSNEYGSAQRYIESLQERQGVFNLVPVKQVTANVIIEHAERIYASSQTVS